MNDKDRRAPSHRTRAPRVAKPLDAAALSELALAYAARFATTRVRLSRYLDRKLKERGWQGETPPDRDGLVARLAALGYVDDRSWAAAKVRDLSARGFGAGRVRGALAAAGVDAEDREAVAMSDAGAAWAAALLLARRRRFGPFAREPDAGPDRRRREIAAMVRAGHDPGLARRLLASRDEAEAEALVAAMSED